MDHAASGTSPDVPEATVPGQPERARGSRPTSSTDATPVHDTRGDDVRLPDDGDSADPATPENLGAPEPLPGDDETRRHRRPRRSLTYRFWQDAAVAVAGTTVLVLFAVASSWFTAEWRTAIAAVGTIWLWVVRPAAAVLDHRTFWYAVSPQEIDVRSGVLRRTRAVVPMNRVQHLKVIGGPVADRFAVATVQVHTAAGSVDLPFLDAAEADHLRARLARFAGLAGTDDTGPDA